MGEEEERQKKEEEEERQRKEEEEERKKKEEEEQQQKKEEEEKKEESREVKEEAATVPTFKSWKAFFLLAEIPEEAANYYGALFEAAEIELEQAVDLTKDELIELDIKLGHRMKILKMI